MAPEQHRQQSTLEGVIERFVFCDQESAWSVVRMARANGQGLATAVGNLLGVQVGERVRLWGQWVTDRKYGEQFRIESFAALKPATLVGMERYLGSGLVRGIGPTVAKRLVEHFGLEVMEVIANDPGRLVEVEGIGPVRSVRIQEAWQEQREIKDVMLFLQSYGVSTTYAIKIYRHYGNRSIAVVKTNPYQLADDIHGIGFKTADKIAAGLGIPRTSPQRAAAGVMYVLGELADRGHVLSKQQGLVDKAVEILGTEAESIRRALERLCREGRVVREGLPGGEIVYLRSLHVCETGAASLLRALASTPIPPSTAHPEQALAWVERQVGISLESKQREAVVAALEAKLSVITGGPGTGKTTIITCLLHILDQKGRRVLLAAPTGRAAKRMQEATGREAKTIHRLLEFSPKKQAFQRNERHPLRADVLIVDEMSMVDVVLLYNLLKAVPKDCQFVLVGDVDQLPSVGPGCVLADIIRSGLARVSMLTEIFRQARRSLIVVNAHRVNRGEMPVLTAKKEGDFFFLESEEPEAAVETVIDLISRRLPGRYNVDPIRDIQVLTPMNRGTLGAAALNAALQARLCRQENAIRRGARSFALGDKVMQLRNNYELEVFNGDIGQVEAIDLEEHRLQVNFDGRAVAYDATDLDELALAYACSVHKAQGSEYPFVVIPIHTQHYVMLQRNLLYTAITRGKRLVVLVGSKRALAIAVRNHRVEPRLTRLAERLKKGGTGSYVA